MHSILKQLVKGLCFVLFTFFAAKSFASTDPPIIKVLDGSKNQVKVDSSVTVTDKYFDTLYASIIDTPFYVRNIVTLRINEDTNFHMPSAFTATIGVRIAYLMPDLSVDSVDTTLTITYDPTAGNTYNSRRSFVFSGAHRVRVTIISVSVSQTWATKSLILENELQPWTRYKFDCVTSALKNISVNYKSASDTDEVKVNWANVIGADEYDVEWTYIDTGALVLKKYGNPIIPDLLFENNATRVTTTASKYNIPLIFPDTGYLFVRVRPVQVQADGFRIVANWSSDTLPGIGAFKYNGHQTNINWQSTTTFAEEGKRKVVVQYYDGSLRGRQVVTEDNTLELSVVAETYYDFQGRPVIQVLPVPTLSKVIKYTPNINAGINGAEYYKGYYDTLNGALCDTYAPAMDTANTTNNGGGAAVYYSPKNADTSGNSVNRFIPNAHGYVFSETEYTQDNTGRISKQGGVGAAFRLGSGHETKYYYGSASQNELDALFGTEVGNHTHYFKNMVRDANGQFSVSYVDMHGRTIATALAGENPPVLERLNSYIADTVTEVLADANTNVTYDLVMQSTKSLLVADSGNYAFHYTLSPETLIKEGCNSQSICYDCLYDLEITVIGGDDCHILQSGSNRFDTVIHNFSLGTYDTLCNTPDSTFNVEFTKYLYPGNYEIVKKLSVSKSAMAYYRDSVFMKKNTCQTLEQFITTVKTLQQISECEPDCASCYAAIGTLDSFRTEYMTSAGLLAADTAAYRNEIVTAYTTALEGCKSLCDSVTGDDDYIRRAMLMDISAPSGQYANIDLADTYSVFYQSTPGAAMPYQNSSLVYRNEFGNPDSVYDDKTGSYVLPQDLDKEQFALKFKASWAETLLPLHPEYCKLTKLESLDGSPHWDTKFSKPQTYSAANALGYLNPTATNTAPYNVYTTITASRDSLAIANSGAYKARLEDSIVHYRQVTVNGTSYYVSLWTIAALSARCNGDSTCSKNYIINGYGMDSLSCEGEKDMAWNTFRQLYLGVKRNIMDELVRTATCSGYTNYTADQLYAAGHYPNFDNALNAIEENGMGYMLSTDSTAMKDSVLRKMNEYYEDNCTAYANLWAQQLAPCNYPADSLTGVIIPRLIEVCRKGSDVDHPFGSREVHPDSTSTSVFDSFDEVINAYNASHGITNAIACNADLILNPAPYNNQVIYSNKPIISKPGECECERINTLYTEYTVNTIYGTDTTFSMYLLNRYNTAMSETNLEQLRNMCNGTAGNCNYLTTAIGLPPVLQCGSTDICIDCARFDTLYNEFEATYDTIPTFVSYEDTIYTGINKLFTNFMNNKLGFSKQPYEYLEFLNKCQNAEPRVCVSCDTLQSLVDKYFAGLTINAGSESVMLDSLHAQLLRKDLDMSTTQISTALATCNLGWDKNIAFSGGTYSGGPYIFQGSSTAANMNIGDTLPNGSPNPFTIETWANFQNVNARQSALYYINKKNASSYLFPPVAYDGCGDFPVRGYYIYVDTFNSQKYLYAYFADGAVLSSYMIMRSSEAIIPSQWYHIVITRTGNSYSDFKIYLNGQLTSTVHVGGATSLTNGKITPIAINNGNGGRKRGLMLAHNSYTGGGGDYAALKNIRLYSRALDSTEIQSNYYNCDGLPFDTASLKLWAKLNEGAGAPLDYSPENVGGFWYRAQSGGNCSETGDAITSSQIAKSWTGKSGAVAAPSCFTSIEGALCNFGYIDSLILCGKAEPVFGPDTSKPITNCSDSTFFATSVGSELYKIYRDSLQGDFERDYIAKCLNAYKLETFTVTHELSEYHYTLYYYDQAGNLLKTVPPKGVSVNRRQTWVDSVKTARTNNAILVPSHTLVTEYRYNTLNQVIAQKTPDAGKSTFYYDLLGRLVVSQNAKQLPDNKKYSYTRYDYLGRIYQVGELHTNETMSSTVSRNAAQLLTWLTNADTTRTQITQTTYDQRYDPLQYVMQAKNLRNRVSWTALYNTAQDMTDTAHASASFYSYDIHGNVDTLIQDFKSGSMATLQNRFKKIVYKYDLVSGKVNWVGYQPGQADAFYHRYTYDAENRITNVETSADSIYWENDAYYRYYLHGPLARTILGDQQVQGVDYAYTLQGWLKGINSTVLTTSADMGTDAQNNQSRVAKDAYGMALYYYGATDYEAITKNKKVFADATVAGADFKALYNGNIAAMGVNISSFSDPYLYTYTYDQLNRLTKMKAASKNLNNNNNVWVIPGSALNNYKESISYDPNGNILTYNRYNASAIMDSLSYNYYSNTNRLHYVDDKVSAYTTDIHDQGAGNYWYDPIGNLTKDTSEHIDSIYWNVYGKITQINKQGGVTIKYTYDPSGNRISKIIGTTETWYVHDVSGNVMSVYTKGDNAVNSGALSQAEVHLYGSSRLGIMKPNINVQSITSPPSKYLPTLGGYGLSINFTRGKKLFEETDHRGNILVTISDKKTGVSSNGTIVNYFTADIVTAQDYSTFGAALSGRELFSGNQVNGLNGQRKDTTIQKDHYTALFWEYDARLGRRWNVDPVYKHYESPYSTFSDNPILNVDPNGDNKYTINSDGTWDVEFNDGEHTFIVLDNKGSHTYTGLFEAVVCAHKIPIQELLADDEDFVESLRMTSSGTYNTTTGQAGVRIDDKNMNMVDWAVKESKLDIATRGFNSDTSPESIIVELLGGKFVAWAAREIKIARKWALPIAYRGKWFEKLASKERYTAANGWKWLDNIGKNFPGIDFLKGAVGVSYKTVAKNTSSFGKIASNIKYLERAIKNGGIKYKGKFYELTDATIDIGYQKGFNINKLEKIRQQAEKAGIKIKLYEIK